jgi:HEAT repeat protein
MMTESQPGLWQQNSVTSGFLELFPAVWGYAEALCSPVLKERKEALARLEEMGAARLSPLVAYLIATRLSDPDKFLRGRVVRILGDLLTLDSKGNITPEAVRRYLNAFLSQMRTRNVYNLLEIAVEDPEAIPHISRVLDACPYAGRHLGDIALDRTLPLAHRKQAVLFIGAVGYLEAIPPLEKLAARLEARLNGQQSMAFAPSPQSEDSELLPIVQSVLHLLQVP